MSVNFAIDPQALGKESQSLAKVDGYPILICLGRLIDKWKEVHATLVNFEEIDEVVAKCGDTNIVDLWEQVSDSEDDPSMALLKPGSFPKAKNECAISFQGSIGANAKNAESLKHELAVWKGKISLAVLGKQVAERIRFDNTNLWVHRASQELISSCGVEPAGLQLASDANAFTFPDRGGIEEGDKASDIWDEVFKPLVERADAKEIIIVDRYAAWNALNPDYDNNDELLNLLTFIHRDSPDCEVTIWSSDEKVHKIGVGALEKRLKEIFRKACRTSGKKGIRRVVAKIIRHGRWAKAPDKAPHDRWVRIGNIAVCAIGEGIHVPFRGEEVDEPDGTTLSIQKGEHIKHYLNIESRLTGLKLVREVTWPDEDTSAESPLSSEVIGDNDECSQEGTPVLIPEGASIEEVWEQNFKPLVERTSGGAYQKIMIVDSRAAANALAGKDELRNLLKFIHRDSSGCVVTIWSSDADVSDMRGVSKDELQNLMKEARPSRCDNKGVQRISARIASGDVFSQLRYDGYVRIDDFTYEIKDVGIGVFRGTHVGKDTELKMASNPQGYLDTESELGKTLPLTIWG